MGAADRPATGPPAEEPPAPPFDVQVCPHCLGENSPLETLCLHCGAPAFGLAMWGGFEAMVAPAWALGEAAGRRDPPPVVAVGGVLLACSLLVVPGWTLVFLDAPGRHGLLGLPWTAFRCIGATMFGIGLYLVGLMLVHGLVRETDDEGAPEGP